MLLLSLLGAAPARAQTYAGSPLHGWMSPWPGGPPAMRLTPSAWVDGRGAGFTVGGSVAHGLPASRVSEGGSSAVEIAGWGSRLAREYALPAAFGLSARLHRTRPDAGIWLATAALASDRGAETIPLLGGGVWTQRGRFTLATTLVQLLRPVRVARRIETRYEAPRDSMIAGRDGVDVPVDDLRLLTGGEASVAWSAGRLEFQTRAGAAVGARQAPARWGELRAAFWPHPGVALFARARSAAGVPAALDAVRGPQAALGVELAPARASAAPREREKAAGDVRLEKLGDGRIRIVLRAEGRSLELCGDATDWSPVPARRLGSGRWEVVLALAPGVHRFAMRRDGGEWRALPGLPTAEDGFGGEVALIVVD